MSDKTPWFLRSGFFIATICTVRVSKKHLSPVDAFLKSRFPPNPILPYDMSIS